MKVKVDVDFNQFALDAKMRERARLAQRRLAAAVLRDSQRYIPFDTGMLKRSGDIISNNSIVRWATRYAEAVYRMAPNRIKTGKNPNARSGWFAHAQNVHGEAWRRLVAATIRGDE